LNEISKVKFSLVKAKERRRSAALLLMR